MYNQVRDSGSAVIWVTFKYDGSTIVPGEQGAEYQHFIQQGTDADQLFAFVRFTTWQAMSKRSKFALITWLGERISGLQRAKTGTDKTLVKKVAQNFAKEFAISDRKQLEEDLFHQELGLAQTE
uniref:Coactosin-like protein n=1 Tax=Aotus nancymaae TaxID=37293 RepID=A0A2K5CXX9_AOTNA